MGLHPPFLAGRRTTGHEETTAKITRTRTTVPCVGLQTGDIQHRFQHFFQPWLQRKKRLISQPLIQLTVGMTRLELATSRPPDAHSNRTELHPVGGFQRITCIRGGNAETLLLCLLLSPLARWLRLNTYSASGGDSLEKRCKVSYFFSFHQIF